MSVNVKLIILLQYMIHAIDKKILVMCAVQSLHTCVVGRLTVFYHFLCDNNYEQEHWTQI